MVNANVLCYVFIVLSVFLGVIVTYKKQPDCRLICINWNVQYKKNHDL